jgi:hypothetical protein
MHSLHSQCTVNAQFAQSKCCKCTVCTVNAQSMHSQCTVCTVNAQLMHSSHSKNAVNAQSAQSMHSSHSQNAVNAQPAQSDWLHDTPFANTQPCFSLWGLVTWYLLSHVYVLKSPDMLLICISDPTIHSSLLLAKHLPIHSISTGSTFMPQRYLTKENKLHR